MKRNALITCKKCSRLWAHKTQVITYSKKERDRQKESQGDNI